MPAAVVGDAAVAALGEEEHLVFERVGRQRPAVAEHDRLPAAPVLVVDLGAVLGGEGRHGAYSLRINQMGQLQLVKLARRGHLGIRNVEVPKCRSVGLIGSR